MMIIVNVDRNVCLVAVQIMNKVVILYATRDRAEKSRHYPIFYDNYLIILVAFPQFTTAHHIVRQLNAFVLAAMEATKRHLTLKCLTKKKPKKKIQTD